MDDPVDDLSDDEGLEYPYESGHNNISLNAIDEKTNFKNIVHIGNIEDKSKPNNTILKCRELLIIQHSMRNSDKFILFNNIINFTFKKALVSYYYFIINDIFAFKYNISIFSEWLFVKSDQALLL